MATALALAGLALAASAVVLVDPWWNDRPGTGRTAGDGVVEPTTGPGAPGPPVEGEIHGRPVHVEVPAIDVSARVVPIDTVGGVLTPPDDVRVVGWWEDGARPGDEGGTVLVTGHTYSRGDGVFDHLGEVARGARVQVVTDRGVVVRYRVDSVAVYPRERIADLAPLLFDTTGRAQLVLTTCSGYDGERYLMTTVVRASPAG